MTNRTVSLTCLTQSHSSTFSAQNSISSLKLCGMVYCIIFQLMGVNVVLHTLSWYFQFCFTNHWNAGTFTVQFSHAHWNFFLVISVNFQFLMYDQFHVSFFSARCVSNKSAYNDSVWPLCTVKLVGLHHLCIKTSLKTLLKRRVGLMIACWSP